MRRRFRSTTSPRQTSAHSRVLTAFRYTRFRAPCVIPTRERVVNGLALRPVAFICCLLWFSPLCPRVAFVPRTLCAVNIFRVFFLDLLMMRL